MSTSPQQPEGLDPNDSVVGLGVPSLADLEAEAGPPSPGDSLAGATPLSRSDHFMPVPAGVAPMRSAGGAPPAARAPDIIAQPTVPPPALPAPTAAGPARPPPDAGAARDRLFHRLALGAAAASAALAALVLIGWVLRIDSLRGLLNPGGADRMAMNPVTAGCLLLSGVSLWLLAPGPAGRGRHAARALAAAAALPGALRLIGLVPALDPGVDRWLFRATVATNRMAPSAALDLLLSGAALALMDWRRPAGAGKGGQTEAGGERLRRRATPVLAMTAGAVALLALTGYAYDVAALRAEGGFLATPLDSVLGMLLLCGGILCARPGSEPLALLLSRTTGGQLARRLLPVAAVLPPLGGWIVLHGTRAGRFDVAFAMMLLTLTTVAVFVGLIGWNARSLSRADAERRLAEQATREAEGVYHSLVETLPQRIFRKDRDGRFTFGNGHFCRARGRALGEIIGKTDYDFSPPELAGRYRRDDLRVIQTGQTLDIVEEYAKPDGGRRYVHTIKTPVYGPDGRIAGVQGIHWDITDRKVAEQELARKNHQLEHAARAERMARVAQQQAHEELKRAQSRLVQSEKLAGLGQMVAGVAHEINNPLAFVLNNVAVLQRDVKALVGVLGAYRRADPVIAECRPDLSAELTDLADRTDLPYTLENLDDLMARSGDGMRRIQQIVKDLRQFARLDESDLHEADLNAGIESTLNIIQGTAKARNVRIEKQLVPLPAISCYPAKLNQVVMNLLTNAIDASRDGGRVVVRTGVLAVGATPPGGGAPGDEPAPVRAVRFEVIDEGSGIPPEVRQRIFDPFFTTKPPGQGTGLGLSISYGIVQDHGGTIDVESEPGKGARFVVTLPLRPPKGRPAAAAGAARGLPGEK